MIKLLLVFSMLLLSSCSAEPRFSSAVAAVESLEKNLTQLESPSELNIDGVKPTSFKMKNSEIIRVYDFGTEEKREVGKKHFEVSIQLLSSHAPIDYQSGKYLILYYSHVDSKTRVPHLDETKYGVKLQKALLKMS